MVRPAITALWVLMVVTLATNTTTITVNTSSATDRTFVRVQPSDMESVECIKLMPPATAIYGARANYGVILVSTNAWFLKQAMRILNFDGYVGGRPFGGQYYLKSEHRQFIQFQKRRNG
jgi:hypothetical protein